MNRLLIAILALLAAGCSARENIEAADREVTRFHRLAAAGQADRLYDEASEDFKRMASPREFGDLLQVIDERLGDVRSANRQGWHVNYAPSGAVVTLTYDTRFERGRGTERFVYRIQDERAVLLGYFVNSPALAPRPTARETEERVQGSGAADGETDGNEVVIFAPDPAEGD